MAGTIRDWLDNLDLGKYLEAFSENEVMLGDLAELTEADLKEMGLPIGPRRRVLKAIADISSSNFPDRAEPIQAIDGTLSQASPREEVAERRRLTILFCDLVGSTELSRKLDPEDLREVMRQYQDTVAGTTTRYGGHVAKYLGDGVLAYFGWPQAYEDQAARGVRAGLDMVTATSNLKNSFLAGQSLNVRVGIATGAVVVGDLSGEADAIVGETPNLAARLQGAAEPGQVLVGEATAWLVEHEFELSATGETDLNRHFPDGPQIYCDDTLIAPPLE